MKKVVMVGVIVMVCIGLFSACTPKKSGEFYTLQEAYDQGLLTQDDLKSIAYYHNGESEDESFVPMPKTPEVLSNKTEKAIKETRAYNLRTQNPNPIKKAEAKDITILKYYGTYNNCVALIMDDIHHDYSSAEREVTIDGVLFHYNDGNSIIIWQQN